MRTSGVVLTDQIRALDLQQRKAKFVEKATLEVVEEALAKVSVLFEKKS